jgi:hypothetical protein
VDRKCLLRCQIGALGFGQIDELRFHSEAVQMAVANQFRTNSTSTAITIGRDGHREEIVVARGWSLPVAVKASNGLWARSPRRFLEVRRAGGRFRPSEGDPRASQPGPCRWSANTFGTANPIRHEWLHPKVAGDFPRLFSNGSERDVETARLVNKGDPNG